MTDAPRTAADLPLPGGDFRLFVQRLGYQGMIALGAVENPLTARRQPHPDNARMIEDDLLMLQEKTAGNLSPEEAEFLERVVAGFSEFRAKHARGVGELR